MKKFLLFICFPILLSAQVTPPKPCGPVPSQRQLAWRDIGFYAFVHFTTNTFRNVEWGYGDASPNDFNPEKLNCEQWVKTFKSAGMKGVIITAKHHDGFCLWPSKLTDYSVKNSKWRNGQGDVVRELSLAAHKYGLQMGVYLSPWDRHEERYGTPAYLDYYRGQLHELLSNYGPIFEIWQDGANGGDGYYGGKKEKRIIDSKTYYEWAVTDSLIRQLQPNACIFGDGGPDTRWCGTESGYVGDPNWCLITKNNYAPGHADPNNLQHGEEQGSDWVPAEVDVSIRPGWFYHDTENDKIKTVQQLLDIFYNSIGRGSNLILNVPADKDGLLHANDVERLQEFGDALQKEFQNNLNSQIASVKASNVRGNSRRYAARKVIDASNNTYWATNDRIHQASLTFKFKKSIILNRFYVREYIQLGQRVKAFKLELQNANGDWEQIATASTIGNKRILRFNDIETKTLRFTITDCKACPVISDIRFYCAPIIQ
jgi:alpha-L-fucosidase